MATHNQRSVGRPALAAATLTPPPAVPDTGRFTGPDTSTLAGHDPGTVALAGAGSTGAGVSLPGGVPEEARAGPLGVGATFGPRYHIIRELGAGGMGAVYQAWDAELGVAVAVKVILPEVLADPQAAVDLERRFKRELLLARQVTHKNVVRIHDLGEIDGIKYITMSYVEGEDLATTLKREGTLAVPRVLSIARQVASGMQAAHEAGVVHRDLKPANIMVDREDRALIMDFGIALSSERGEHGRPGGHPPPAALAASRTLAGPVAGDGATLLGVPEDDGATVMGPPGTPPPMTLATGGGTVLSSSAGFIIGTLEYMAPEQSRGDPVDQRTDIYAFGMILSDLLVGRRQLAEGTTAWDELQDRVSKPPVPLRERNPDVPEALDALVTKCTQVEPGERFQTTAELVAALHRLDANGQLIPETTLRRFTPRIVGAAAILVASLVGGTYWLASRPEPVAVQHAPVSVLVADFENKASDPVFDGLLEQALTVGVEGASFVTAYPRRDALRLAEQLRPEHRLDEATAVLVALREGVQRVLTGSIGKIADRYQLSIRIVEPSAVNASASKVLMTWTTEARNKDEVLGAVAKMAARVREELGDATARNEPVRAEESFSASSLEAARAYTAAQELAQNNRDEQAIALYREAIASDGSFGRAYAGWATSAYRLGRTDEAAELWKKAISLMDRMSERERYRTLGGYYLGIARNYDKAIENYSALVGRFPADGAGLNSLGVAYFGSLNFQKAVEQGRKAIAVYPRNALYRNNLALYAMYAGEFSAAATEAQQVLKDNPAFHKAYLPVAIAALAAGKPDEARVAYEGMAATGARGASLAAAGLADLAFTQGRLTEAEALLARGITDDAAAGNKSPQAIKQVMLAEVHAASGKRAAAVAAARAAMALSRADAVAVPAARVLLAAGREKDAGELAASLDTQLQKQSRAYARLVEAEIALQGGRVAEAIDGLTAAKALADLWLVRFSLGRAYIEAGHAPEGLSELESCLKRRGEATAVFLDDVPSYRYVGPLYYWLARAQEGVALKTDAAANYRLYLDQHGALRGDALAADARARLAALE